jgi:hypothetical protein
MSLPKVQQHLRSFLPLINSKGSGIGFSATDQISKGQKGYFLILNGRYSSLV